VFENVRAFAYVFCFLCVSVSVCYEYNPISCWCLYAYYLGRYLKIIGVYIARFTIYLMCNLSSYIYIYERYAFSIYLSQQLQERFELILMRLSERFSSNSYERLAKIKSYPFLQYNAETN
jgi:hypothetical protein